MLNYNKYKYHVSMMQNANYFKSVNYKYKRKLKKKKNPSLQNSIILKKIFIQPKILN